MSSERETIHAKLLSSLYAARKRVADLEAAVAHNAALLGIGIEYQDQPEAGTSGGQDFAYLELVEKEDDISDYLGREGDDASRPQLGDDAPAEIRPNSEPRLNPLVHQVALAHPDDAISFPSGGTALGIPLADAAPVSMEATETAGAGETREVPATGGREHAFPPIVKTRPAPAPLTDAVASRALLAQEATNEGVWDWDIAKGTQYQSPRWLGIFGSSPDAVDSPLEAVAARLHPADAALLRSRMAALIGGRLTRLRMVPRIRQQDGSWSWGLLQAVFRGTKEGDARVVATLADITEEREAELTLRASEEKFRALAEESQDFIACFDRSCRFIYASRNARRYLPVAPENLIGQHYSVCCADAAEAQFFEENLQRVFEIGMPVQADAQLAMPGQQGTFVADCRFWPELGPEGDVVSVTAQVRDMTSSRRMMENYHALFNSMADGFAVFERVGGEDGTRDDADAFTLLRANPAIGKMLRLDVSRYIGRSLRDLLGDDAPQWAVCLDKVLKSNRPLLHSLRNARPPALFEMNIYTPESGRVACLVKDVTEIRELEQEIRLNETRFAALYRLSHMDAAPEEEVVRFSLDQTVHLTGSSMGYLRVLHGREGEKIATYWSRDILTRYEDTGWVEMLEERMDSAFSILDPQKLRKGRIINAPGGEVQPVASIMPVHNYMAAPIIEDGRVVCIVIVANKQGRYGPSDLRQLELFINGMWFQLRRRWAVQSLKKAKEAAEAANDAKNQFLANVSHELRTPLNGILGMLQLLQQSSLSPEQMEYVSTANYSGRSLLRIISDILDFSRIEAGRLELKPQLFDFAATVRSTLGMFLHQAEEKKLQFSLNLSGSIPPLLLGDDARVRQIVFNLVGNAFKFTRQGSVTVEGSLLPIRPDGKHCVYFVVRDTGIGIPDEKLDVIFQAFTQLDGSSTRRYQGAGLGLGIVQRLVNMMGGSLCVESALGEGTAIHCSLPFIAAAGRKMQSVDPAPVTQPLDILVAEDDLINQQTIRRLLEKAGHRVICVGDGRQALEALMLRPFDCLITDIQMPDMDGVEVVSRIRQGNFSGIDPTDAVLQRLGMTERPFALRDIDSELPVIALTAHAMAGDKEHFLALGMDYYLSKPIIASELAVVLHQTAAILCGVSPEEE